jgi:hypothetical protein
MDCTPEDGRKVSGVPGFGDIPNPTCPVQATGIITYHG